MESLLIMTDLELKVGRVIGGWRRGLALGMVASMWLLILGTYIYMKFLHKKLNPSSSLELGSSVLAGVIALALLLTALFVWKSKMNVDSPGHFENRIVELYIDEQCYDSEHNMMDGKSCGFLKNAAAVYQPSRLQMGAVFTLSSLSFTAFAVFALAPSIAKTLGDSEIGINTQAAAAIEALLLVVAVISVIALANLASRAVRAEAVETLGGYSFAKIRSSGSLPCLTEANAENVAEGQLELLAP